MIIPFSIFLGALIGIVAMLVFKVVQIRKGKVEISEEAAPSIEPAHEYMKEIFDIILYFIKRIAHEIVMLILKAWVYITHIGRKGATKASEFVVKKLEPKKGENESPSIFLQTVSEYKKKAKSFKKKLEQKDKKKAENKIVDNQE